MKPPSFVNKSQDAHSSRSSIVSQKYLGIVLRTTLPPAGGRSLRAAISLQGRFERPHNLNTYHRAGTEEHANRRVKSYGAAQ
jgi:hypothetical protein